MLRPVAIYLPQFHPIPENDEWWGKGFTEWRNVTRAKPLFEGHYQPHFPADLGYYDLRLPEIMQQQTQLASRYGIEGFCFYHYWFNGRKLLERPVEEMLKDQKINFPFMLCWANENWTRTWDGGDDHILLAQRYSDEDDIDHMHYLMQFFKDPRYIRVGDKPVFVLYKTFLLPDATATAKRWREVARQYGMELYLCHMVFKYNKAYDQLIEGFDAAIDFEPFGIRRDVSTLKRNIGTGSPERPFLNKLQSKLRKAKINTAEDQFHIREYKSMFENLHAIQNVNFKLFPSIVPGWDNTARKPKNPALILNNSTPALFRRWFSQIVNDFKPYSREENFIFINAWNEWAEGNHMEPCLQWGHQYLESVKSVLDETPDEH